MGQIQVHSSTNLQRSLAKSYSHSYKKLPSTSRQSSGPASKESRQNYDQPEKEIKDVKHASTWRNQLDSIKLPLRSSSQIDPSYQLIQQGAFSSVYVRPSTHLSTKRPVVLRVQKLNLIDLHDPLVDDEKPLPLILFRDFFNEVVLNDLMSTHRISPKVHKQEYSINQDKKSPAFGFPEKYFIIMDKYNCDLFSCFKTLKNTKNISSINTQDAMRYISRKLIKRISKVASLKWVLLDIKAENIVLDMVLRKKKLNVSGLRLIDFGGTHCQHLPMETDGYLAGIMILILVFQLFFTFARHKHIAWACRTIVDEFFQFLTSLPVQDRENIRFAFLKDGFNHIQTTLGTFKTVNILNNKHDMNVFVSQYLNLPKLRLKHKQRTRQQRSKTTPNINKMSLRTQSSI